METTNISLSLLGVNSPHCALRVQNAIRTVTNLGDAHVDLERHRAQLNTNTSAPDIREAVAAIRDAGYNVATDLHTFSMTGLHCAGCANTASTVLNSLAGVVSARVDHVANAAEIEVVRDMLTYEDMLAALKPAGYGIIREVA